MQISALWRKQAHRPPLVPDVCGGERHVLRTARLVLRTPRDLLEVEIGAAAGADAEAQRWLGHPADSVLDGAIARYLLGIDDRNRVERLRGFRASVRRQLVRPFVPERHAPTHHLVAIEAATGRVAGASSLTMTDMTIGLRVAPAFRRQGLGSELARATALFAHAHLGLEVVWAGTETSNAHCRAALTAAGFGPCDGPAQHSFPDGRVVDAVWYRHATSEPSHCTSAGPDRGSERSR